MNTEELTSFLQTRKASTKYRCVKTFNGIEFDVAKSALQKYIRRGNTKKAQMIACEMDFFRWIPEGKRLITNFYNRLRVITLEDVGLANPGVLHVVDTLGKKWLKSKEPSRDLLSLVKILCETRHSRFYSHMRGFYRENKPEKHTPTYHYNLGGDEKLRDSVDNFVWCVEKKDVSAWYWMEKILGEEKLEEKRNRSTRPGFLIFDVLRKLGVKSKTLDVCEEWYKTLKIAEQFLCCIHPVYIYIFGIEERDIFVPPVSLKSYDRCFSGDVWVDDYVYDAHTSIGRKMKRDEGDFAVEGSLVSFEKEFRPEMAFVYMMQKVNKGSIALESREFKFKTRTQLICSDSRPDTYFAKNRIGQNVVVKGPYLFLEQAVLVFNIQNMFRLFQGVNSLDVNIKLLVPDMFDGKNNPKTPLGSRRKIKEGLAYYFVVMNDLCDQEEYPEKEKESKVWPATKVVDFEKLFNTVPELGFGVPSEMDEKTLFNFLLQITIRYLFKIGDFFSRNFFRVGGKTYNLDTEGIGVGRNIRFSKSEQNILLSVLRKRRNDYVEILEKWKDVDHMLPLDISKDLEKLCRKPETLFEK